ncbi:RHS repeat protein [Rhizobacter sp. AJA081-3]|uniref:RHS repeat protein n=1 Tax=Rhizobacter sp. AJA081-3 TaxID=2753607 RepID=UPI001AE0B4BA|nr:RHS repeat protein [Rhizobacter sp. AJA081-3]QTN25658.1 RHS repeat protein [Rhizobacter sp. AJA081-3]
MCVGHPISLPSQSKVFREVDYRGPGDGGLKFIRDYRSDGFSYPATFSANLWAGLGNTWTHNYAGFALPGQNSVWVSWGQSSPDHFYTPSGSTFPRVLLPLRPGQKNRLVEPSPGRYVYFTTSNEAVVYQGGLPIGSYRPNGQGVELGYVVPRLSTARDTFGRTLAFNYDAIAHLESITDPAGQAITYAYRAPPLDPEGGGANNVAYTTLARVTYQDLQSKQYTTPNWVFNDPNPVPKMSATRIAGIVDELGATFETVTYDTYGQVTRTELAGGVSAFDVTSGVLDPLGTRRTYQFDTAAAAFSYASQPAGSGCPSAYSSSTFDTNGNLTSSTDFRGSLTCYTNDSARNIESSRVEGLGTYAACNTYTPPLAALPAGSRKLSTQWHPDWRLASKIAEPNRVTTYVYNGQPDPFNANATASCAPATAQLPDGKPIAVLCRQVEQATTDANGSQGFSAALQAGVANREQKWTYNQYGQVLTHDGPRTDVVDVTTYAYYNDTSFAGVGSAAVGHTIGDLQSVTNAAGKVTQYTKYDKHGKLLESVDPNGVVSSFSYDLRQRLLSITTGGQITSYTYDAAGQLKRITRPDASYIGYDYDPAHRQTAVFDNLGNRIEYTLDSAGNRTAETVKDTSGALRRLLARSVDALGRVQQVTGRE